MRRLAALVAPIIAACSLAFGGGKAPPVEIKTISMGWQGNLASERWNPAVVWITSQDKPFTGVIKVEFDQDSTQKGVVMIGPVSTTPGFDTPVELDFALPAHCEEMTVSVLTMGGSVQAEQKFTQQGPLNMPLVGLGENGLIAVAGNCTASKAIDQSMTALQRTQLQQNTASSRNSRERTWDAAMLAVLTPDRLPMAWTAYQSIDVLIVRGDSLATADPRCRAAVMTWVNAGGRLVLQVDAPGSMWRTLFPPGEDDDFITLADLQKVQANAHLTTLLGTVDAAQFQARTMKLTKTAESRGWKTLLPVESGDLVAYGPVGLGMVCFTGFDPAIGANPTAGNAVQETWREVIWPIAPPHFKVGGGDGTTNSVPIYYRNDVDPDHTAATLAALNEVAIVPKIGAGTFFAIAACVLLLAIMIGPVDAKVLKRLKQSQRSWMTALAWITLASVGAILAPRIMRSGETVITRLAVHDTICSADGKATCVATTGVIGVFAGQPMSLQLGGQPAGSWMRGVSAIPLSRYGGPRLATLSPLEEIVMEQGEGTPLRGAWPQEVRVPQWAFRTLSDCTPLGEAPQTALGVKVHRNGDEYQVDFVNAPKEQGISGYLRIKDNWIALPGQTFGPTSFTVNANSGVATPPLLWQASTGNGYSYAYGSRPLGTPLSLPWAHERADAIEAMVASGKWACVYVKIINLPMDLTIAGAGDKVTSSRSGIYRLLTPLEGP